MTRESRCCVLLGPATTSWSASLERSLKKVCVVQRSTSRAAFLKQLRVVTPHVIVLYDTDERGTPNAPLLRHCAKHCPSSHVVFVHPGPAMRMPSAWTVTPPAVSYLLLSGKSRQRETERVARLVQRLAASEAMRAAI